jgi:hypothetical protein
VNPLIDASVIKVKLAEQMRVVMQLFPRYQVTVQVPPELLEQIQHADAKAALPAHDAPSEKAEGPARLSGLSIVVPERIGVVKAWDFRGTRLHIEFAVMNDSDRLVAIRQVMVHVGAGDSPDPSAAPSSRYHMTVLHFKQFVDVTPEARLPSKRRRLPVVVKARDSVWLCAEVESPEDVGFGEVGRKCSLLVVMNEGGALNGRFTADGDSVWASVLAEMQATATEEKSAAVIGLPIAPIRRTPSS